jgi:RHH-type proline utilization regulon transcriptional repressor/proline dehydrogenase/delta 1-pyrroline-5-carboxylate dehydrogenase
MTHWLDAISAYALSDEKTAVEGLLARTSLLDQMDSAVRERAETLIASQRARGAGNTVEAFLQSYGLSTKEGVAMMCLAEALLRIPDAGTADQLIEDTFATGDWKKHLGQSDSSLVNASTWALMLTGSVLELDRGESLASWFGGLIKRSGEPVIRQALRAGMKFLGTQFVMGETVADAISNARTDEKKGYSMSYDILGEGARTDAQAQAYVNSYLAGIREIAAATSETDLFARPGISVKLSALHPRYAVTQSDRVFAELLPRLKSILRVAMEHNISVALDAEEANRLELHLDIYKTLVEDPEFADFGGIGFVLQAYQKRAVHVAVALRELSQKNNRKLPVRLVKGAYWDSEIKYAQVMGLPGYPVFTRKAHTDLSYLACARELLADTAHIYPQFATHNALSAATVLEIAAQQNVAPTNLEFQRLHGMGESLHDQLVKAYRVRIYAPVGAHKDLLAYLIRRLLENGANSSFVHLLLDQATPVDTLTISPLVLARKTAGYPAKHIPLPAALYGPHRQNPEGIEFGYRSLCLPFLESLAIPLATLPATPKDTAESEIDTLVTRAADAFHAWNNLTATTRATHLRNIAKRMDESRTHLLALLVGEAKKTYADAVSELREAMDFCYYYANEAERISSPQILPGPTGESNVLTLHGRGPFLCISPWNFPLAIFTGQVVAALVTGNPVIAKPAEQTPRIAAAAVAIMHQAGIPSQVLQLACGAGETIGAAPVSHPRIAGVCFTGSTAVAKHIARALAAKDGPIVPLIAETGGLNAMIVDSSALLEQAVDDIIISAFGSAGQRCSSLRMLFVQHEVAQDLHDLLIGAMNELRMGETGNLATDIGPVIDADAQQMLLGYIDATKRTARWHHQTPLHANAAADSFVPPTVLGLDSPESLTQEMFGPVLHFFTYKAKELPKILGKIHDSGYGLTFGLHTRLRGTIDEILGQIPAGNRYVNRSMTGAVVGVQPFGGEGLSGTGPKAGGPHYLLRFVTERTTTINTAAIGGNVELLA